MSLGDERIGVVDQNKIVEYRYSEKAVKNFVKRLLERLGGFIANETKFRCDYATDIVKEEAGPKLLEVIEQEK